MRADAMTGSDVETYGVVAAEVEENKTGVEKQVPIHPRAKLYIEQEAPFFGPGPYRLLRFVEKTGSLRLACSEMQLSYSKGWRMIKTAEKVLGYSLAARSRGGAQRGQTQITARGKALLKAYEAFEKACTAQIEALFAVHFSGEGLLSE